MSKRSWAGGVRDNGRRGQRLAEARGAVFDDLRDVILNVTAQAGPLGLGAAERGQVVEVGRALGQRGELVVVVHVGFVARAVDEPDLLALAAVGAIGGEEPLRVGAHGRDVRAGGDEDGIGDGLLEHEAIRPCCCLLVRLRIASQLLINVPPGTMRKFI